MSTARAAGEGKVRPDFGRELPIRVVSAAVLAALALAGAWFGGWIAASVIVAAVTVVHLEWVGLTEGAILPALPWTAALAAGLFAAAAGFPLIGLVVAVIATAAAAVLGGVWRPLGLTYAAIFGFGLLLLRLAPGSGFAAIVFLIAIVAATDTGAFFAGRIIGGPKLWPAVSPMKTWAGAIGGLVAGTVAGLVAAIFLAVPVGPALALVSAGLSIASQLGDLFESAVKRRFGAKDAGRIIPGHGGLMDRVDGLIVAGGVAALLGCLHGGPGDLARGLLQW